MAADNLPFKKVMIPSKTHNRAEQQYSGRLNQFRAAFPSILEPAPFPRRCLYIGAKVYEPGSKRGFQIGADLVEAGWIVDILEAHRPNAESFHRFKTPEGSVRPGVIVGDVRRIQEVVPAIPQYDAILWYHGPEHVERSEIPPVLVELKRRTRGLLVVACPWGRYKQGPVEDNEHERHLCHLDELDMEELGLQWTAIGRKNSPRNNNLMGWAYTDEEV